MNALILFSLFGILLIIISIYDWITLRIPNFMIVILASIGICLSRESDTLIEAFMCSIGVFFILVGAKLIVEYFLKKPVLGLGDIKLGAACGLFLWDISSIGNFLFYAGSIGIFLHVVWKKFFYNDSSFSYFPFGPALAISIFITFILK